MDSSEKKTEIRVEHLRIGYGDRVLMDDLNFEIRRGEIFFIMGGSGCGKSTLLKHLIGLYEPMAGDILIGGRSIVRADEPARQELMRSFGVSYQGGALFGSLSVAENVAMPLEEYSDLTPAAIAGFSQAFSRPFPAISSPYFSVAFVSAMVLVRGTAPGMFPTQ